MESYLPATPYEVLAQHYRKGVLVLENDPDLRELKLQLYPKLKGVFPKYALDEDSSFFVFCRVKWPSFEVEVASDLLERCYHEPIGEIVHTSWFVEFVRRLIDGAHIDEFMRTSVGELDYVLSIDFYPNRAPGKTGGYHKDSNVYTTFIVLSYFNEAPVWGPEWILDLGQPRFNGDTGSLHWDNELRWYEEQLPEEVKDAINRMRRSWLNNELRGDSNKTLEEWVSLARSKVLPISANIAFFDPIITHSSPNRRNVSVFKGFHPSGIRQDFDGGSQEPFGTPVAPSRRVQLDLANPQKRARWVDSEHETFQTGRAFLRVEVQAIPKGSKTT